MAYHCTEWDGWEEGLVDSFLGKHGFEVLKLKNHMEAEDEGDDTFLGAIMELKTNDVRQFLFTSGFASEPET